MKKRMLLLALCLVFLTACGGEDLPLEGTVTGDAPPAGDGVAAEDPGSVDQTGTVEDPSAGSGQITDVSPVVTTCRVVDGAEEGQLLLADLERFNVYSLTVDGDFPILLDGAEGSAADLEDGMLVEVSHSGMVLESFPAQFAAVYSLNAWSLGSERSPGGGYYDLCGLYLKVLDDLWSADSGLNSGVEVVSVDLSQAPGDLTDSEKAAIAYRFGVLHGVGPIQATFQELVDQGLITAEPLEGSDAKFYEWENGILFAITAEGWEENEVYSLPVLKFEASKWRSSLGAYGFSNCTVLWPEFGTWSDYNVGAHFIS